MGPPVPPVLPPPRPPSWRSPPPWSPWCRLTKLQLLCHDCCFPYFFSIPPVLILDLGEGRWGGAWMVHALSDRGFSFAPRDRRVPGFHCLFRSESIASAAHVLNRGMV